MNQKDKPDKLERQLWRMQADYRRLPYGPARIDACREAVEAADRKNDPYWRIATRYDFCWAGVVGGDPPAVMPVCAAFFALMEEYPGAYDTEGIEPVGVAQIAAEISLALPQLSLAQCRALLDQFADMTQKYGIGERVYHWQACRFYALIGEMEKARREYTLFQGTKPDIYTDCPACERAHAVWFLLRDGRYTEAEEMARPVLAGALTCEDQPHEVLSTFLKDALLKKDLQAAAPLAQRLYPMAQRDKSDLEFLGNVLLCWSNIDQTKGLDLIERYLPWAMGLWDQNALWHFYLGAGNTFSMLAREQDSVRVSIPREFPLYQEEGRYAPSELADWFHTRAAEIGRRFDSRNGAGEYTQNMNILKL